MLLVFFRTLMFLHAITEKGFLASVVDVAARAAPLHEETLSCMRPLYCMCLNNIIW